MSSISLDSDDDICLISTGDSTTTPKSSSFCLSNVSGLSSSNTYSAERLQRMLLSKNQNVRLQKP